MTKRKISRREFITISSVIGSAALLQACGLSPTETATYPLSTSLPTKAAWKTPSATAAMATATARPTGAATSTPSPTETASPAPTGAASPTTEAEPLADAGETSPVEQPTPTPSPTPYPPGPPSKLGLFITRNDSQVLEVIKVGKPPLIKTLELDPNFAKGIKTFAPASILIGRIALDQMNLDAEPLALARQFVDALLPVAGDAGRMPYFDAWEAYNEPIADTPDKMKRLADFEAERARLLAPYAVKSVVGNFATGHPPLELWPQFDAALASIREFGGYLGLHEYSAPIMQYGSGALQQNNGADQGDEGWLTLRYRKVYRNYLTPMGYGNIPLLITECGVDGLVGGRPGPPEARGWKDFIDTWLVSGLRDDPPGVYMDQLIWYDKELRKDDYVKGAAIFVAGASPGWESYDILGRTAELLQQYLEVHPQY